MQDTRPALEELLRKLHEFERTFPTMSVDTRREFESMIRMVKSRLAGANSSPQG